MRWPTPRRHRPKPNKRTSNTPLAALDAASAIASDATVHQSTLGGSDGTSDESGGDAAAAREKYHVEVVATREEYQVEYHVEVVLENSGRSSPHSSPSERPTAEVSRRGSNSRVAYRMRPVLSASRVARTRRVDESRLRPYGFTALLRMRPVLSASVTVPGPPSHAACAECLRRMLRFASLRHRPWRRC